MSEQPHAAHGGHDDHGHSPFIQHHYDDAQHQFDSGKLGIWIFLAQEVLFFSALFVAYILYRHHHPEIYEYAHKYLDTKMGAINTAILIFSSLTAAWAVRAAQLRQQKLLIACLATTIACACGFLVIKYFEYTHKIHEHILFGKKYDPCISSNGTPLINKGNNCPGTKSTIIWDTASNSPEAGSCLSSLAIDTDPRKPFVQADCKVYEVTGAEAKGKDGKVEFVEKSRKEITGRCADLALGRDEGLPPGVKETFPCWKPNYQPHVCKSGWYFNWWCDGPVCEKPFGGEGPFATAAACSQQRNSKESALKSQGTALVGDCTHGTGSGILVDYGDHREREDIRIKAECKGPAAPVTAGDPLADKEHQLVVGKAAVTDEAPLTHHELKEMHYSGPPPEHTNMFFTIYFAMTGLHGIHVLVGVFIFIWLLIRAVKGHFTPDYFGPVDFAALYWHIVDLIWIFLFPLMYLIH